MEIVMSHKPFISNRILLFLMATLYAGGAFSQTVSNDFQTRTEVKLSYQPLDKLSLSLNPEIRWDESFQVDKYMLESGISYEPVKGLSLGGSYRFIINPRTTKATEYLHRFALFTSYKKKIERFEPSLRIKYTNYTEDASQGEFLRYRAKLEYDIKSCLITPLISAEAFHNLSGNQIYKMRYTIGAEYKLNKKNSIALVYMLDYYLQEYRNKHILRLGYKYKF
jgi:hypothetical protein